MCLYLLLEWKPNDRGFLSPPFKAVTPMSVTVTAHSRCSISINEED